MPPRDIKQVNPGCGTFYKTAGRFSSKGQFKKKKKSVLFFAIYVGIDIQIHTHTKQNAKKCYQLLNKGGGFTLSSSLNFLGTFSVASITFGETSLLLMSPC